MGQKHSREVPVLCINLKSSVDRRDRMLERAKIAKIDRFTIIEAVAKDDSLVDHYIGDAKCWYPEGSEVEKQGDNVKSTSGNDLWRRDIACYVSHIKALRYFVKDMKDDACLISEDDTLFHNDFIAKFKELKKCFPPAQQTTVVQLCWMISGPIDQTVTNKKLWKIDPQYNWSTVLYYITRKYAIAALERFDKPLTGKMTSEEIVRTSGGYMAITPLAIEDGIDSDRAPQDLPFHLRHFCHWYYNNYNIGDPQGLSPLKGVGVEKAWKDYPFKKSEVEIASAKV